MTAKIDILNKRFKVTFPYAPDLVLRLKTIPGWKKWESDGKYWLFSISKLNADLLDKFLTPEWSRAADEERQKYNVKRIKKAELLALPIPQQIEGIRAGKIPHDYQKQSALFMEHNKRILITDEPGIGKTLSAIVCATHLKTKRTLIVAPKNIVFNWINEIVDWTGEVPYVIDTKMVKKLSKMSSHQIHESIGDKRFVLTNYEMLGKLSFFSESEWDCFVVDECHYITNKTSKRSIEVKKIKSDMAAGLTGTPVNSRPIEFWSILDWLVPGEFGTYHEFGTRYANAHLREVFTGLKCGKCKIRRLKKFLPCPACRTTEPAEPNMIKVMDYSGSANLDELHQRLDGVMIRRKNSECLELPPHRRTDTRLTLTAEQQKQYNLLMSDLFSYLIKYKDKDPDAALKSCYAEAMTRLTYARQYLSKAKIEYAINFISQVVEGGESIVVYADYRETIYELERQLKDHFVAEKIDVPIYVNTGDVNSIERGVNVMTFQKKAPAVIIMTLDLAVGINLTMACYDLFLDVPWEPSGLIQAERRTFRQGQLKPVNHTRLFFEGTYDIPLMGILVDKQQIIDQIMDGTLSGESISIAGGLILKMIKDMKLAKEAEEARYERQEN